MRYRKRDFGRLFSDKSGHNGRELAHANCFYI